MVPFRFRLQTVETNPSDQEVDLTAAFAPDVTGEVYARTMQDVTDFFAQEKRIPVFNEDQSQVHVCKLDDDGTPSVPEYSMEMILPCWVVSLRGGGRYLTIGNNKGVLRKGKKLYDYNTDGTVTEHPSDLWRLVFRMQSGAGVSILVPMSRDATAHDMVEQVSHMFNTIQFCIFVDAEYDRPVAINSNAVTNFSTAKAEGDPQ